MNQWLLLAGGGVAGTFLRYLVARWVPTFAGAEFPYGTLAVNLSACLLLGIFESMAEVRALLGPQARILLMTGFCGAYSTFSTWMLETSSLVGDGELLRALANLFGSAIAGFVLFRLGAFLGAII
ncbi:MAG: fluoride efflux transporter CrcB [Elusimicrobia bacterium]|nr:fluoride efflux transporter CrcB [Elusimicrobiota bacterium]